MGRIGEFEREIEVVPMPSSVPAVEPNVEPGPAVPVEPVEPGTPVEPDAPVREPEKVPA